MSRNKHEALLLAAAAGDLSGVNAALSRGASTIARDEQGLTALMLAVSHDRGECVRALLPVSDPCSFDHYGATALMMASKNGNADILSVLLPVSDTSATDSFEWNALMWAAAKGHAECVGLLLHEADHRRSQTGSKGFPGKRKGHWKLGAQAGGLTPLMCAAKDGHAGCVKRLLPVSDVTASNINGWTALMWAVSARNPDCVRLLLPDSDLSAVNVEGQTALDIADTLGDGECSTLILGFARATEEVSDLGSMIKTIRKNRLGRTRL